MKLFINLFIKLFTSFLKTIRKLNSPLVIILTLQLIFLTGCCKRIHPDDPFEPYNRVMFKINKVVDNVAIKPFAYIYNGAVPKPIKMMVGNFFQNFKEIPNVINDALQGNRKAMLDDGARFVINSTLGIGGLFDIASYAGLKPHTVDFGLTLAHWGNRRSNYLVLPILGPSTIRDAIGFAVTYYMSPWPYIASTIRHHHHKSVGLSNGLFLLYMIDTRARLLELDCVIKTAAVEEYAFVRDAYLQRRAFQINEINGETFTPNDCQNSQTDDLPEPPE